MPFLVELAQSGAVLYHTDTHAITLQRMCHIPGAKSYDRGSRYHSARGQRSETKAVTCDPSRESWRDLPA